MPVFRQLAITGVLAISVSTGCCLTKPCGIPGGNCGDGACGVGATGCCDAGPTAGGDDGCCAGGCGDRCPNLRSLLGLGCIKKLFHMSCNHLGCGSGCGEVYWHDWISDPPSPDPCDTCGNWAGNAAMSPCDGCADSGLFRQSILTPSQAGPTISAPGPLLYSGLVGMSSWGSRLKQGVVSQNGPCAACTAGTAGSNGSTFIVGSGVPVDVTTQQIPRSPGRAPHPVVADRLR